MSINPTAIKNQIIKKHLSTEEGRAKLLESLRRPVEMRVMSKTPPLIVFRTPHELENLEGAVEETLLIPSRMTAEISEDLGSAIHRMVDYADSSLSAVLAVHLFDGLNERSFEVGEEALFEVSSDTLFMSITDLGESRKNRGFTETAVLDHKDAIRPFEAKIGIVGIYSFGRVCVSRFLNKGFGYKCGTVGSVRLEVLPLRLEQVDGHLHLDFDLKVSIFWDPGVSVKKGLLSQSVGPQTF